MKHTVKTIGIIAFAAVIGFLMTACGIEHEKKDVYIKSLSWLTGTWKGTQEDSYQKSDVTAVFSDVIDDKINLELTWKTTTKTGYTGPTSTGTTGYVFLDSVFGLSPKSTGKSPIKISTETWNWTYTLDDIHSLNWDYRTLGKEKTLRFGYLTPGDVCDCDGCDNIGKRNCYCSERYCGSKPQGTFGIGDLKKQ